MRANSVIFFTRLFFLRFIYFPFVMTFCKVVIFAIWWLN
ncbi:putative membrane protein [Morganella morganii]|nr:putative membrane protein [Morganella morganii]